MELIGNIDGMKFSPISGYNNFLKNSEAFKLDESSDFENILAKQSSVLQQSQPKLQGAIEVNTDFNRIFVERTPEVSDSNSASDFMKSMSNSLSGGLNSVNKSNVAAEKAQEAMAMGENVSVHDVMIATEKANLSMQMAMQVRNKLLQAFNEIKDVRV